jgi:succinylarginine dihydrolase
MGNVASMSHSGEVSHPRAAALQGIAKMRSNLALGLSQGFLLPHPRPNRAWLEQLGNEIECSDASIAANAMSASAMWAANAATVSPAPDTADGRCHLTPANLRTMPHRSHEWPATLAQLKLAFSDSQAFRVHDPVPSAFGDEGAANHMRLTEEYGRRGLEIFVYGTSGGPFPARQHLEACKAIARLHELDPERTLFIEQSKEAIAAGAFHNDVVAVANERVLLVHEKAFESRESALAQIDRAFGALELVEVPDSEVPLADAIRSYLFNAQLVSPPGGEMTLVVPSECRETPTVWSWIERHLAGNGPIRAVEVVDVRQSMANGGGPACLRLRVVADPATVDPRFLVDEARLDTIEAVIEREWPENIHPSEIQARPLIEVIERARQALLEALDLGELA